MGYSHVSSVSGSKQQSFSQQLHKKFLKNKWYASSSCRFQKMVRQEYLRRLNQSIRDRELSRVPKPATRQIKFVKSSGEEVERTIFSKNYVHDESQLTKKIIPKVKDSAKFKRVGKSLKYKLRRKNKILNHKVKRLLGKDNNFRSILSFSVGFISLAADLLGTSRYIYLLIHSGYELKNENAALSTLSIYEWETYNDTSFTVLYGEIKNNSTICLLCICYVVKLGKCGREEVTLLELCNTIEQYNDLEGELIKISRREITDFYNDEFRRSVLNRLVRSPKGELVFNLLAHALKKHMAILKANQLGKTLINSLRSVPFIGTLFALCDVPGAVYNVFREVRKMRSESVLNEKYSKLIYDLRVDSGVTSASANAFRDLSSIEHIFTALKGIDTSRGSIDTSTKNLLLMYKSAINRHYDLISSEQAIVSFKLMWESMTTINRYLKLNIINPSDTEERGSGIDFSRSFFSTLNTEVKLKITVGKLRDTISARGEDLLIMLDRLNIKPDDLLAIIQAQK